MEGRGSGTAGTRRAESPGPVRVWQGCPILPSAGVPMRSAAVAVASRRAAGRLSCCTLPWRTVRHDRAGRHGQKVAFGPPPPPKQVPEGDACSGALARPAVVDIRWFIRTRCVASRARRRATAQQGRCRIDWLSRLACKPRQGMTAVPPRPSSPGGWGFDSATPSGRGITWPWPAGWACARCFNSATPRGRGMTSTSAPSCLVHRCFNSATPRGRGMTQRPAGATLSSCVASIRPRPEGVG